jgi:hypothetical protein
VDYGIIKLQYCMYLYHTVLHVCGTAFGFSYLVRFWLSNFDFNGVFIDYLRIDNK